MAWNVLSLTLEAMGVIAFRGIPGFVGTRGKFNRLSDRQSFGGWIEEISPLNIVMRWTPTVAIYPRDEFQFMLYGEVETAHFEAQFQKVLPLTTHHGRKQSLAVGALIEVDETLLEFAILSPIDFDRGNNSIRRYAGSVLGIARSGGKTADICVLEASKPGIGFISDRQFEIGEEITIELEHEKFTISVQAEVRHSNEYCAMAGMFRTGVRLLNLDRLTQAKWNNLFSSL